VTNTYNYAFSSDGKNWTTSTLPGTNASNIKWTGSKFLMDGLSGNNLLTSKTGQYFSSIPIQGNAATYGIYDLECNLEQSNRITFPQNTTLAVGGQSSDTTKIAYSTDSGITWSSATSATGVFSGSCNGAAWNGKLWVAVGSLAVGAGGIGNTLATSPDGITWTGRGAYIFSTAGNAVAWSKELGLWVATGQGTNIAAYSYDGVYWFAGSNTSGLTAGLDVKWNGSVWVLVGTSGTVGLLYSANGKVWTQVLPQNVAVSPAGNAVSVIWNGQAWINAFSNNTFITSSNGISWNSVTIGVPSAPSKLAYSTKSGATLFLTTGSVYSTYTNNYGNLLVGTLPQGIKGNSTVSALLYNGAYYLVGGNVVVTSLDAQTWTKGDAISGMSVINNFVWNTPDQGTASINPITVALGQGNTNTIGYSYDGIQWYGAGSSVFTVRANKAAWSGQIWCAVGTGLYWVASSYDGVIWTGRNTYMMNEGYDIAWNGVAFVAVGVGASPIVTSPDGINWYPVANSSTLFTNYVSSIVWTGFVWIAYGSTASGPVVGICTNPNGTIWTTTTLANLSVTPITRPIVTKTNVLHPLTTTSGSTYLYSTADLYGNSVSGNVNLLYPINGNLTGLQTPVVTATVFDGYNYLVVDSSGNSSIITNQASNTNLVFSSTYAGSTLATNLTTVYGGAYNGRVVMLGGATTGLTGNTVITYNTFGTGTASQFFPATSANSLFTQVNGLASNSGYGPVYVANALYLNVGDKLSIVGPKAYSQSIAPTTSITMNLMNTTTNPQNIKTVYPSITPTK